MTIFAVYLMPVLAALAANVQAVPPPVASRGEAAVLEAETRRLDAQVSRDVAVLGPLIADDGFYIHANGQTQAKMEYLRDVAAGTSRYRSIETSDRTIRLYGNTAVTHGQITLNVGVDRQITGRYTGVYLRRAGRWLVLSWQTTPIQPRS